MPTFSAGEASLAIVPDARQFKTKLEADLKRERVELAVPVTADLARARSEIDKFRVEQEAKAVHLRVEVDRANLRRALDGVRGDFASLGSTLGSALKIDAAMVGVDLLPALATGLASVAQALQQVAQAGLAVPGILAGVGASVGTLALGLSGVKDAWSAVDAAASTSGASQARTAQQAVAATNALRNAKVDEANAQKDVANAYKDARQQLEDLNIEQRGGVLSEKEAILEAAKARRDLATGRYKDALDYQSAQLRVEEADQRVVEARQHNIELNTKLTDANAKGITGADQVVAANERLTRSHQAVAAAQASIADQGAGGAVDKAAEAMAKLAPNARDFVNTMLALKPAFKDLQGGVQQNLFAGMSVSLRKLADADLPHLKTGLGTIATSLNHDLGQLFSSLGSDSSKGLLDRILGNTGNADERLRAAIDPLVHAVGVLTAAGSDSLPRLADAMGAVADRFDHFISAADKDGRLKKWISDGLTGMTHLGDIALNLGKSFTDITKAVGGQGLLASLDQATRKLEQFLGSTDGQKKLVKFFQDGKDEFHKWEPIIENLAKTLPPLFQAAHDTAETFRPIIKDITDYLAKNPEVVRQIADGFLLWETAIKPISTVAGAVSKLMGLFGELKTAINLIGPAMTASSTEAGVAAGAMSSAFAPIAAVLAAMGASLGVIAYGWDASLDRQRHLGDNPEAIRGGAVPPGFPRLPAIGPAPDAGNLPPTPGPPPPGTSWQMPPGTNQWVAVPLAGNVPSVGAAPAPADTPPPPAPGAAPDDWKALADLGDPVARWVVAGKDPDDIAKRAAWVDAHKGAITPSAPFNPPAAYDSGGPTHDSGGGRLAVVHPKEYVANPTGRATLGDAFLAAANQGRIDPSLLPHFDVGGPGDKNPADVGPAPVAPSPMGGGGGILNNVLGGITSGIQGPIGNVIGMFQSAANGGGGGGGSIPGIWGLLGGGGSPDAMNAWGSQTASWLSNFGAKTAMNAGSTLFSGLLGGLGLGGSILSPSNVYNQAAQQTAGFFLGDQSPLMGLMGGGGTSGGGIGAASITVGDGSTIQIPTFGTAQGPGGAAPGSPDWNAIAAKESGGDWHINTGNGFFGGLQFTQSSWEAAGGGAFAARADLATPEQQKQVAAKLFQMQGPGAWPNTFSATPAAATGSGTGLTLVPKQWGGVDAIAAQFGLSAGSRFRDPNGPTVAGVTAAASYHGSGRATDYNGTPEQRLAFARFMAANYGPQLKELIYDAPGFNQTIKDGQVKGPFGAFYTLAQAGDHSDHVHIAFAGGGVVPGGHGGIDDVDAKLTAGEFVVNKDSASRNMGLLRQINAQKFADGGEVLPPVFYNSQSAAAQHLAPQPAPQVPNAQHQQQPAPAISAPPAPAPTPVAPAPTAPTTAAVPPPSLTMPSVAAAPSNLDHNLKAIDTGIDSGAQAIGQALSTAIGVAGGAAGGFGGGAIGAIGPYVAGLVNEGGKVAKNVVNVGSSFLVGNVTPGTQDLAYGSQLRSPQNYPNVAPAVHNTTNISGNYELTRAMDLMELKQSQEQQATLARADRR